MSSHLAQSPPTNRDGGAATPVDLPAAEVKPKWRGIDIDRVVHNSAYDAATFRHEMQTIFRRAWIFVCHESEIAQPGQYMRRTLPGGEPIIVVRDTAGALRAFHNVCPHRATLVVVEEEGCSKSLMCPYHNWSFRLDGSLQGVPMEAAYAETGFQKENFGLTPLGVDTQFGLVFVRAAAEGPTLQEFLGADIVSWLDRPFNQVPLEVFKRHSRVLKSNWKGWAENARDGYHVPFVHKFLKKGSPPQPYHLFSSGHQIQQIHQGSDAVDEETWRVSTAHPFPGFQPGEGYIAVVFPDLVITPRTNVIEIFSQTPLDELTTLLEIRILGTSGDSPEERHAREAGYEVWLSKQPDEDAAIMEAQGIGLQSSGSRVSLIARGQEGLTGTRGDDKRLRQFWGSWREYTGLAMNAGVNDQDWWASQESSTPARQRQDDAAGSTG